MITTHTNTALWTLNNAVEKRNDAQLELEYAIQSAKLAGASWQQIADKLGMTKQSVHQRYKHLMKSGDPAPEMLAAESTLPDDSGTEPLPDTEAHEFKASNSKVTQKVLVQAVLNGLDVRKEELPPLYNGAYEQIAVTIQEPHGNGWLYLVQTVGSSGKSSHGAYIAYTTGGKARKLSIQGLMQCIREWGNPNETTQAQAAESAK